MNVGASSQQELHHLLIRIKGRLHEHGIPHLISRLDAGPLA
jgi:hypothetical protein